MNWIKINSKWLLCMALILILGVFTFLNWTQQSRIKYVDTITLFNEFILTKQLEAKDAPMLNKFKMKLDSLHQVYGLIKDEAQRNELGLTIYQFENEYKGFSTKSNSDINDLVWTRLNPMIHEYGKKNGFTILFGANGMGNVLYAEETRDETKKLIEYCNKAYKDER